MDASPPQDHLFRVTPLTYYLVVVLAITVATHLWGPGRLAIQNVAADQAAIEKMVKDTNDFAARIQCIRDVGWALTSKEAFNAKLQVNYLAAGIRTELAEPEVYARLDRAAACDPRLAWRP